MKKPLFILIIAVVSIFSFTKLVLPRLIAPFIGQAVVSSINQQVTNFDFGQAKILELNQGLSQNKGGYLSLAINKGVVVDSKTNNDAISGQIRYLGEKPSINYSTNKEKMALYQISSAGQSGEELNLHLSKKTNFRIDIGLGAGSINLDLRGLDISLLNIGAGAGNVKIIFSDKKSTKAVVAAGAGKLDLLVPTNSERRFEFGQGVAFKKLNVGDQYVLVNNGYQTKNFEDAAVKIRIIIGQAAGGFNITPY